MKVDTLLIVPNLMGCWAAMSHLPVKAVQELLYHASLYAIGSKPPRHTRGEQTNFAPTVCSQKILLTVIASTKLRTYFLSLVGRCVLV